VAGTAANAARATAMARLTPIILVAPLRRVRQSGGPYAIRSLHRKVSESQV
jgi:hypothetical protein